MKVFLAGATGVLGIRLVALLLQDGHAVTGMTRSLDGAGALQRLGAKAVVCDVYDRERLTAEVVEAAPELVMHELTDLPDSVDDLAAGGEANARMRVEGTDNLLAAARAAGATRFLAQSIAWDPPGAGGEAKHHLEASVRGFGGVVVRYGRLFGPGTFYPEGLPEPPRIHVDEAARRTVGLLELGDTTVTLVDEEA